MHPPWCPHPRERPDRPDRPRYKAFLHAAAAIPFALPSAPPSRARIPQSATLHSPAKANPPALVAPQGACTLQPAAYSSGRVAATPAAPGLPARAHPSPPLTSPPRPVLLQARTDLTVMTTPRRFAALAVCLLALASGAAAADVCPAYDGEFGVRQTLCCVVVLRLLIRSETGDTDGSAGKGKV